MNMPLLEAEVMAQKALDLPAFNRVNLNGLKEEISQLLALIGRDGIFDEYTRHDISHVNAMLMSLQWLIPDNTKSILTPAEWLMLVLAIYFHDLGLLVTREEFQRRDSSKFVEFKETVLFAGENGKDYKARVNTLDYHSAERFLYQEFVRHNHAVRIKNWIVGQASEHLGITSAVMERVQSMLQGFSPKFRKDLALICESHHLDDLGDFSKYRTSVPYGSSKEETVNLHYIAILLRTADLLHITRDRTPSVEFQIINPTDPLSQLEWAKQQAVTSVRPKIGLNRENKPDETAPKDTIEVHAYFFKEDGFFGLISYLVYAREQLKKSHEWIKTANDRQGTLHLFPWRHLDDLNIETEGFLRETYAFTIDQAKILDLLTGHTLYNDTRVVLRELAQNALDAVRLQQYLYVQQGLPNYNGRVVISWNSADRTLCVEDNGTGMTQEIVKNHLLQVGSSRYQDSNFKREFPNFSSISRFGIGLLSAFMIADEVEITTCHPAASQAIQLSLRSVHGRYLIRLLDKFNDPIAHRLSPHGTIVKLTVRQSAIEAQQQEADDDLYDNLDGAGKWDVLEIARRWIVLPECEVFVKVDNNEPVCIGHTSPKDVIQEILKQYNIDVVDNDEGIPHETGRRLVRVEECESDGVTLAYALQWVDFFQEWAFLELPLVESESRPPLLGTCVEGIRVDFNTPGYDESHILAIANAKGANAPKTNVARTGLESATGRDQLLRTIFNLYCDHIRLEMKALQEKRQFSATWAIQEASFLLLPLFGTYRTASPIKSSLLLDAVKELPVLIVEEDNSRRVISPAQFQTEQNFWTVDSRFFTYAEMLGSEILSETSLTGLVKFLQGDRFPLPDGKILTGQSIGGNIANLAFYGREVEEMIIYPEHRRVDLKWTNKANPHRWRELPADIARQVAGRSIRYRNADKLLTVGARPINIIGLEDQVAVRSIERTLIIHGTPLALYLNEWLDVMVKQRSPNTAIAISMLFDLVETLLDKKGRGYERYPRVRVRVGDSNSFRIWVDNWLTSQGYINARFATIIDEYILTGEFFEMINSVNWKVFDTMIWIRDD